MDIEGNVLANTLANSAAEDAYQSFQSTRDNLPVPNIEDAQAFTDIHKSAEVAEIPQRVLPVQTDMKMNPGDEILKSIQNISDNHTNSLKNLNNLSEKLNAAGTISMAGALEMQKSMMEFQLKQDIISRATGSINQGIQTLFKNQ